MQHACLFVICGCYAAYLPEILHARARRRGYAPVLQPEAGDTLNDHGPPQLEISDETLVARIVQRDVPAFSLMYDRYAPTVYTLAAHMLGPAEAEEVVQEVFLRLWHKADQFDATRGSFGAWFMTITRHRIFDEVRRRTQQQRLVAAEQVDHLLAEVADPSVDVEQEAWLREQGSAVLQALQSLPDEQRQVLVLAYFGGLSQSAIARHLDCPLGTVKKRIRLGMHKLRLQLRRQGLSEEPPAESTTTITDEQR